MTEGRELSNSQMKQSATAANQKGVLEVLDRSNQPNIRLTESTLTKKEGSTKQPVK